MKTSILFGIVTAACVCAASAADYSVFRVCQDQRVIRTSDGAEAGHIEYIVVDPSSREIVSTVVSGGVEGDHLLAIPYASLRFNGDREITLTEITRERLVSAPVIERSQFSTAVIAPDVIERTREHFSVRGSVEAPGRGANAVNETNQRPPGETRNGEPGASNRSEIRGQAQTPGSREARDQNQPSRSENTPQAERNRENREGTQPQRGASPEATNPRAEDPNRNQHGPNARNEENNPQGANKTPRNANERANTPAEKAANGEKPTDEPSPNAATTRPKKNEEPGAAAEEKANKERSPRGSSPEGGARNAEEGAANSKKNEPENSEAGAAKHGQKKSPSSGEEKEKREPRSPQN